MYDTDKAYAEGRPQMIAYHITPYLDGYRIHRATTSIQSVMIGGRLRPRKVTRFDFEDGATYPTRRAAQAVLCKLAAEAEFSARSA